MESKKKGLGAGLTQLFDNNIINMEEFEKEIVDNAQSDEIVNVNLDELRSNPYQPRKVFDEDKILELSNSIKEHGVFQPIIIKKTIKGYHIIAGERRVKASIKAGMTTIPAIIRDFSDEEMMQIALLENLQRENLTAIEEAIAYKNIIDKTNITQDELGKKLGKSRSHITNMIGLLRLPDNVKDLVLNNSLSMAHARILSKLDDDNTIDTLAKRIIDEEMSVKKLEELTKSDDYKRKLPNIRKKDNINDYKHVEEHLKEKLGTKVKINDKKIEISFFSIQDLNRILEIMNIDIER